MGNRDNETYAAAELGTVLRGDEPAEHVRPWAGLIEDEQVVKLLNHYASVFDVPVEESPIGREILRNCATETVNEAVRHGNVSQMKAATGLTGDSKGPDDFFLEVATRLSHEGTVGLGFGSPGSGKTAKIVDAANVWRAITGGKVFANIDWDGADDHFSSDRELYELMASHQGKSLALIDEVAQELSGFGTANVQAEAFSDSLLLIRKRRQEYGPYAMRGSVLCVGHTRTKTAKEIRRIASFAFEVPDKRRPDRVTILDSTDGQDDWDELETFQGITDTAEQYDEYDESSFEILEEYDDDGDGDVSHSRPENAGEIERALRMHLQEGESQYVVAEELGVDQSTVARWKRRYERDEFPWLDL